MREKNIYRVASLFSGCGGMDLGVEGGFKYLGKNYKKNPVQIVYALDKDKSAAKRKCQVHPTAYAYMYASGVCSGKITPGGKKGSRKKAAGGGHMTPGLARRKRNA